MEKFRKHFENREFVTSVIIGCVFLFGSVVLTFFAILYATESASGPVADIVLSNIPVFDVDGLFLYGPIIFWAAVALYILIRAPHRLPFTLKSIALFLAIRSIFISLTHIGPFLPSTPTELTGIWTAFTSGKDLFFSGHAGMPFLIALAFWDDKFMRAFAFTASIFFSVVVLLGHFHYSIDVFAAFFITFTIFHMAKCMFRKDFHVFMEG